jgi:two-component system phosphate regulon sensor histidine kinase PhoR
MFGVKEDDIKGKSLIEMSRNQQLVETVKGVLETKEVVETEIQLIFPQEVMLHSHVAPILRQQEVHGMVLIFTDITELRRLERVRTEFVGNVSHELKTPLTSIKGYVETLLDMEIEHPMINKFLGVISKESDRLSRLIGDLLDLSRLEGKRNGQLVPTRLQDVMENVITILQTEAERKKVTLKVFIPPRLPRAMGIEEQLNQVFINLIENAIKYTPDGGRVIVSAEADEEWVILKVADNGLGIPQEDLDRIFERFYRVDKARSRQAGGTGLGLSIVKHIVKGHGGDIWVESQVGGGSTFTVKFQRETR